ncbi:MAG: hypothetical protein GF355_07655 [Candidatus Eisenbacteria bacterium]|nr:hypothetical protein [Candidatus Eisenbacteria bacterium]
MRRMIVCGFIAALLVFHVGCSGDDDPPAGPDDDEALVLAAVADLAAATEAQDLEATMACYWSEFMDAGLNKEAVEEVMARVFEESESIDVTMTGLDVTVHSGSGTAELEGHMKVVADGQVVTDEDFGPETDAEIWLDHWIKQGGEWLLCGDQVGYRVRVETQHYFPDDYSLGVSVTAEGIDTVTVNGPNIVEVWNHPEDPDHYVVVLSQRPINGDAYEIQLHLASGETKDHGYTVDGVNDSFAWMSYPSDGETIGTTTPAFVWSEATGIEGYGLVLQNEQGSWIWMFHPGKDETSCVFNEDGEALEPLMAGRTYRLTLHTFDPRGNQASTQIEFSVQ